MAHRSCINLAGDDKKDVEGGLDEMGDNNKSCRYYINLFCLRRSTLFLVDRFLFVLDQAHVLGTNSLPAHVVVNLVATPGLTPADDGGIYILLLTGSESRECPRGGR
jgi:hypothetical protein